MAHSVWVGEWVGRSVSESYTVLLLGRWTTVCRHDFLHTCMLVVKRIVCTIYVLFALVLAAVHDDGRSKSVSCVPLPRHLLQWASVHLIM